MKFNVILVEDDEATVFLTKKIFEKHPNFNECFIATNGFDAVTMLEQLEQKIISEQESIKWIMFIDLNMPVMNGFEFVEYYSTKFGRLHDYFRIAVITTSLNESDRRKILAYNCVYSFFSKPINIAKLTELAS